MSYPPDGAGLTFTGNIDTDTGWAGKTPGGTWYRMHVRPGTSDWNTAHACGGVNDEYHLPSGLKGWALDIGAHIGAATIPFLLDNPGCRMVAVEALPENADLVEANAQLNGVSDRLTLLRGAASRDERPLTIHYAPDDAQHQYIGNQWGPQDRPGIELPGITLATLAGARGAEAGDPFLWTKIDCEGCEYEVLDAPEVELLQFITGEVHQGWARLVKLLSPTHQLYGLGLDFGPFSAVLRQPALHAGHILQTQSALKGGPA